MAKLRTARGTGGSEAKLDTMSVSRHIEAIVKVALSLIAVVAGLSMASSAVAQDPVCGGAVPRFEPGAKFAGQIRRVIAADAVCIGRGTDPATWIDVRLEDVRPRRLLPGASKAFSRIALGQYAVCTVDAQPGRQVVRGQVNAVCRVRGIGIGPILRKQAPAHYR